LPDVLKQNGYHIANINKRQNHYEWDTTIDESESGFGRDIPFHGEAVRGIIETTGENPWFIMANFNDPHRPFHGSDAEKDWTKYDETRFSNPSCVYGVNEIVVPGFLPDLPDVRMEMAQYYSSVRRCDDGVGTILESLEKSGEAENTIVVFMSDHGISNPFSKMNCYQVSLRVPLIVRYPGKIEAGRRDKFNMVSAVDLAPTLLELAGLDVPATMAGRSFTPLLAMWKAAESVPSIKKRTNFHKYRVREELYNVRQDPHAYINVAPAPENRVRIAEMQAILVNWMEETDHPALDLMKDPHNEKLISEYMEWERLNAVKQVEEVKRGKR
jgi:N-sulfoglucosamine sulfohydrolase